MNSENEGTPLTDAQRKLAIVKRLRGTAEKWNTLSRKEQEVLFDVIDDLERKLRTAEADKELFSLAMDSEESLRKKAEADLSALRVERDWLLSHCRAVGMTKKSISGQWSHDVALFTIDLKDRAETVEAASAVTLERAFTAGASAANTCKDFDDYIEMKRLFFCALPVEQAIAQQTGTIGHVSHNMPAANAIAQQEKGESVADQHFRQNTETWKGIS